MQDMIDESVEVPFTREMIDFLLGHGYTHILSLGAAYKNTVDEEDNYWLEPLRPDDPRLKFEEADHIINFIKDSDVIDMAHGDEFIRFLILIPKDIWNAYVK